VGKYVGILKERRPAILTRELYERHIAYLQDTSNRGALVLVGPLKDQDRVLQIIQADTRETAETILTEDPFVSQGYFGAYELYELMESNAANNWLRDTPRVQEMLRNL